MVKSVQTMPTTDDPHNDDDDDNVDEDDNMNYENDDDDEEENDEETTSTRQNQTPPVIVSDGRYHNKQRCLTLCSRGVTARYRHLLEDLRTLIPHNKKESKLDCNDGSFGAAITNICDIRNCNTVLYMECRKRGQDAYLYMGYPQTGPSVKFHITNIHTMDELKLTGNCMKYSRPILSFDTNFNSLPQLQLLKNIFIDIFGIPRRHPKSKPFVDRVMAFYYGDNRIWVRNYQILEQQASNALEAHRTKKITGGDTTSTSLVEIGPRFVLNPIRIFRGGNFGGQTLYQNPNFVSPNTIRANEKRDKGMTYTNRKESQKKRKDRLEQIVVPEDPLSNKRVFR